MPMPQSPLGKEQPMPLTPKQERFVQENLST
jgi:hypothetical protein